MKNDWSLDTAELRRAFDRTFAEPRQVDSGEQVELVKFRVAEEPYVVRADEIVGVIRSPRITRVPAASAALLGLGAVRGAIVAWFDLGRVVGRNGLTGAERCWGVLARRRRRIGFVFDELEGLARVEPESFHESTSDGVSGSRPLVRLDGRARPVLSLVTLLDEAGAGPPEQEKHQEKE